MAGQSDASIQIIQSSFLHEWWWWDGGRDGGGVGGSWGGGGVGVGVEVMGE